MHKMVIAFEVQQFTTTQSLFHCSGFKTVVKLLGLNCY